MTSKRPSTAQAKELAHIWSAYPHRVAIGSAMDSTWSACVKRGWLVPSGEHGVYPNGERYEWHVISQNGLIALRDYFAHYTKAA